MAEVADPSAAHGIDPWLVHQDDVVAIRCFDARAGSSPDLLALVPELASIPLARMHQVHGAAVASVDPVDFVGPDAPSIPEADGLLAEQPPVSLVVRTADCVPLVLWDVRSGACAAIHAGWRGLVAGIVPSAVRELVDRGSSMSDVRAWVGPSICGACYPVGADVQEQIVAVAPAAAATSREGGPAADVAAGVVEQLRALGVGQVVIDGRCTRESPELFSARGGDAVDRLQVVVTSKPVGSA